jgi:glycosyltransferase involved in cell wall biosynthesis
MYQPGCLGKSPVAVRSLNRTGRSPLHGILWTMVPTMTTGPTDHLPCSSDDSSGASAHKKKRIAIFIVTYNAAGTLRSVLERIPKEVWQKVEEVFVFDDESKDDTYLVGIGYKVLHGHAKLSVFRNEKNLGYGGNQIRGYKYAIEQGYDIVALLHGDGQYAPEALPELLAPLETGEADAVFGSRMMTRGGALRGGMPLYKYVGNKILTRIENDVLGTSLSEFHSGYRLYSCHALERIPFEQNTHDFHFDTQIIIQLHAAGMRIVERPIPTYYGNEICHVNGMRYAKDVLLSVVRYQMHELGIRHYKEYEVPPAYAAKKSPLSSHSRLLGLIGNRPRRVLDIGCGQGELSHLARQRGHHVVGIDMRPPQFELDEFIEADISQGLPIAEDRKFDIIVLADVLEHVSSPERLLLQARRHLAPDGRVLVSLPNAVHWSVRAVVGSGRFDYTNQGILERGHVRFFTLASAKRLFEAAKLSVRSSQTTPVPWERVIPRVFGRTVSEQLERTDYLLTRLRPNFFAYQHIFELQTTDE